MKHFQAIVCLSTEPVDGDAPLIQDHGVIETYSAMTLEGLIEKVTRVYDLSKWELISDELQTSCVSVEDKNLIENYTILFSEVITEHVNSETLAKYLHRKAE